MSDNKTACSKCGQPILEATAKTNQGLCMPCKKGFANDELLDGVEVGLRLVFALIFAGGLGVFGFQLGSRWSLLLGLVLGGVGGLAGFLLGFFLLEIKAFIRAWISMFGN